MSADEEAAGEMVAMLVNNRIDFSKLNTAKYSFKAAASS